MAPLYADGRSLGEVARTTFKPIEYEVNAEIGKRTLEGCMLLPHDYESGRRYPVIVEVYTPRSMRVHYLRPFCASLLNSLLHLANGERCGTVARAHGKSRNARTRTPPNET
ncbi:hypothetical protein GCM10011487_22640 [Steroidobacter agaridevorans]|uniref:Uncharacterized protein n=1 Tax=Steroidobacter agaridevorans TaxID=2695856 RepID=A0A829YA91_9GAMM|nr:hypothetical protein GCM10011487_22640 [Steroidobacter agaridevorans]GFE87250.1 hypothetical protein GCM10011488_22040 [Steroidobacter agaridevorans]